MKKLAGFLCVCIIFIYFTTMTFAYQKEIATATSYYEHPVTKVIEDAGNNKGIGQSMTESVLHPQALVEEDDNGNYFLTVRFNLANHINNETFATQLPGGDFYKKEYEVTQQTEESKDYRIQIEGKNVVVRTSFYVGPMGRDVIFYFTLSDFVVGNTDFVTMEQAMQQDVSERSVPSATVGPEPQSKDIEIQPEGSILPSKENSIATPNITSGGNSTSVANGEQETVFVNEGNKVTIHGAEDTLKLENIGYDHGLLLKDSPILKKIRNEQEAEKEEKEKTGEEAQLGSVTLAFVYAFLSIISLITVALFCLAIGIFLYYKKLKWENERLNEEIYDD